jgi:hypothetical protein
MNHIDHRQIPKAEPLMISRMESPPNRVMNAIEADLESRGTKATHWRLPFFDLH